MATTETPETFVGSSEIATPDHPVWAACLAWADEMEADGKVPPIVPLGITKL